MSADMILFILAVIFFLIDALKGALKVQSSLSWTPLAFACITAALWLV